MKNIIEGSIRLLMDLIRTQSFSKEEDQTAEIIDTYLKENGVDTMIYYPLPLHIQPVFESLGYKLGDFPNAEKAANEALSLPMFPELKEEQQRFVVEKIAAFFSGK